MAGKVGIGGAAVVLRLRKLEDFQIVPVSLLWACVQI